MVTLKYFNEVISRRSEALKKGIDALIFMGIKFKDPSTVQSLLESLEVFARILIFNYNQTFIPVSE